MGKREAVEAILAELYAEWFAVLSREGTGRLDEILADEWVYTNYDGLVRGKDAYLIHVDAVVEEVTLDGPYDLVVRRYGDVVLTSGGYRVTGLPEDAPDVELRFSGAWIDRDGRWQCLIHHNSAVV